nr:prenyltransferase [Vicinamibacterales bacterium]
MSKLAAYAGVAKAPFLTPPFALVAAGTAAAAYDDTAGVLPTVLALVGLLALHVAVNAFNEASDMKRGIDLHTVRTPFSGGSGVLPAGDLTVRDAVIVGAAGSLIGLVIGLYFLWALGWWPFGVVMILGALAVLIYTDVFVRSGFGELFAGLGLGLLPVIGAALVQRNVIGPAAWAAGIPAFFMTFNLLLLNEFPEPRGRPDLFGGRGGRACVDPWGGGTRRAAGLGDRRHRADVVRAGRGAVGRHAARRAGAAPGHGRQRHLEPRDAADAGRGPRRNSLAALRPAAPAGGRRTDRRRPVRNSTAPSRLCGQG